LLRARSIFAVRYGLRLIPVATFATRFDTPIRRNPLRTFAENLLIVRSSKPTNSIFYHPRKSAIPLSFSSCFG